MRRRHETSDVHARAIAWVAVAMALSAVLMHLLLGWGLASLKRRDFHVGRAAMPVAPATPLPEPRLEIDEARNATKLRQEARSVLGSYGWVDRSRGIARIPIERAMEIHAKE